MQPLEPQVKVVIDQAGNVKLEVQGVQGPNCMKLTRDLEVALAGGIDSNIERDFKPTYYEPALEEQSLDYQAEREGAVGQHQLEGF